MKKYILLLTCLLCITFLHGQNMINISPGMRAVGVGPIKMVVDNYSMTNNGNFTDNGGDFLSLNKGLKRTVSGSTGNTFFYNFTSNTTDSTFLQALVSVTNTVVINSGYLHAGSGNLYIRTDINPNATIYVAGVLEGTVQGLITNATSAGGLCPLSSTLSLNISGPAMRYQWQSSPDNTTWTSITGATSAVYNATALVTTYYRCNLSTNNSSFAQSTPTVLLNVTGITATPSSANICDGSSVALTVSGFDNYVWSPSRGLSSTTGSSITAAPDTSINYVVTGTSSGGCIGTTTVTVNVEAPIGPISGSHNFCLGDYFTVTHPVGGGSWSISDPYIAFGDVYGNFRSRGGIGTATITYTSPGGCFATHSITVNPLPGSIGLVGWRIPCVGIPMTCLNSTPGGVWSVSDTTIANIDSISGNINYVSAGGIFIIYSLPTGCSTTLGISVNPVSSPIVGTDSLCASGYLDLTNADGRNTWTSSDTSVATVDAGLGFLGIGGGRVEGVSPGTAIITYNPTGCYTTHTVTVFTPPPGYIISPDTLCIGNSITLTGSGHGGALRPGPGGFFNLHYGTTIYSLTGNILTGLTSGTDYFSYSYYPYNCSVLSDMTKTITVIDPPTAITGTFNACAGATTTLSHGTSGGRWYSANPSIAIIGSTTGIVTGIAEGTVTIDYLISSGCSAITTVTINGTPALTGITGSSTVCIGGTTTLSNSTSGGTWSSSNSNVTVTAGVVSGVALGTSIITYSVSNSCGTSVVTKTITIAGAPSAGTISGTSFLITGVPATITSNVSGGVWTSSNTGVATIGSLSGIVNGLAVGTAIITYRVTTSCGTATSTYTETVLATMPAITGPSSVCTGSNATLSNAVTGGIWSSSSALTATIGSLSGIVTGVSAGTSVITYRLGTAFTTATITVLAGPSVITGVSNLCVGSNTTYSNSVAGGVWSSSDTLRASINSSSGYITGVALGAATITYGLSSGCIATKTIAVGTPAAIGGATSVCVNGTATVTNPVPGGIWTSGNTLIATIGSTSGIITGVAGGSVTISYNVGCFATTVITVNATATISGAGSVCVGQSTTLTSSIGGGSWSSSNTGVATISTAIGAVYGVSPGTTTITYTTSTGCIATATLTVNPSATIGGPTSVCMGATSILTNSVSGGIWSVSNPTLVTIGSASGVVSGISAGVLTVTYTTGAGCTVTAPLTVNSSAAIGGGTSVCATQVLNLTNTYTGTWSSGNTGVATIGSLTGQVTGQSAGTAIISFVNTSGCLRTTTVLVNAKSPIVGSTNVCTGQTITLTNSVTGGTWTSNNTTIASVGGGTGVVSGNTGGAATISYTTGAGCVSTIGVNVTTIGAISGLSSVCGSQSITLTNPTAGGTWSSSNTLVATVGTTGVVTGGVGGGVAIITYSLGAGCVATKALTVNPFATIVGSTGVCVGQTITLTNATPGGAWASSNPTLGSIDASTGILRGRASGTVTISYTIGGCRATQSVAVSAAVTITGTLSVCSGYTSNLTPSPAGGVWSSSASAIGTVSNLSVAMGVSAGTCVISYSMGTGCYATAVFTVNPLDATTGPNVVCNGQQINLSNTTAGGGTWTSGNITIATVGTTGIVSGLAAGATSISFTTPQGCRFVKGLTVNALSPIGGITAACVTLNSTLTNPVMGTWTSSNISVATVGSATAQVTGVSAGTTIITYIANVTGCTAITTFTVHPQSNTIGGPTNVCISAPVTLTNTVPGGTWSVTNTAIASINVTTGVVTAVGNASTNVTYTTPRACRTVRSISSSTGCRSISGESSDVIVDESAEFTLIPNPNIGEFTIKGNFASGEDVEATIEIVNMVGRVVHSAKTIATAGKLNERIQLNETLANGMYLLNLHSTNENKVFHFVLSK